MHRDNKSENMVMTEALLCEKMKCSVFCLACPGGSPNLAVYCLLAFHGVSRGRRVFRAFEFKVGRQCFPESLKLQTRFSSSPLTAEKRATEFPVSVFLDDHVG